jgi:hypothetical protein
MTKPSIKDNIELFNRVEKIETQVESLSKSVSSVATSVQSLTDMVHSSIDLLTNKLDTSFKSHWQKPVALFVLIVLIFGFVGGTIIIKCNKEINNINSQLSRETLRLDKVESRIFIPNGKLNP